MSAIHDGFTGKTGEAPSTGGMLFVGKLDDFAKIPMLTYAIGRLKPDKVFFLDPRGFDKRQLSWIMSSMPMKMQISEGYTAYRLSSASELSDAMAEPVEVEGLEKLAYKSASDLFLGYTCCEKLPEQKLPEPIVFTGDISICDTPKDPNYVFDYPLKQGQTFRYAGGRICVGPISQNQIALFRDRVDIVPDYETETVSLGRLPPEPYLPEGIEHLITKSRFVGHKEEKTPVVEFISLPQ